MHCRTLLGLATGSMFVFRPTEFGEAIGTILFKILMPKHGFQDKAGLKNK